MYVHIVYHIYTFKSKNQFDIMRSAAKLPGHWVVRVSWTQRPERDSNPCLVIEVLGRSIRRVR